MDVRMKWWENVRGQCQRSYCWDSPALSVICNLDCASGNFTAGLMLGRWRFYNLSLLRSSHFNKTVPFWKDCVFCTAASFAHNTVIAPRRAAAAGSVASSRRSCRKHTGISVHCRAHLVHTEGRAVNHLLIMIAIHGFCN